MSGVFIDNDGQWSWRKFGYHARSAFAVLLSLAVLTGGAWFTLDKANQAYVAFRTTNDYLGPGEADVLVTIPRGASINEMGDLLLDADVIKSMKAFKSAAASTPGTNTIQAGKYKLKTKMSAAGALAVLLDPKNIKRTTVTIPEGWDLSLVLPRLTKATGISNAEFKKVLAAPKDLGLPTYAKNNAEGFLFPETYEVDDKPTATAMLTQMVDQFTSVSGSLKLEARAKNVDLTPYQVVIMASIIEAEVHTDKYRPLVAEVLMNRLAAGEKLQLDSTVSYATGKTGTVFTTDADRAIDSPFNTYKIDGLPPSPINSPGKASLSAVLNPGKGNYMFFTVVNLETGETEFSTTFEEHQKSVAKLQQWCAANTGKC